MGDTLAAAQLASPLTRNWGESALTSGGAGVGARDVAMDLVVTREGRVLRQL
ncbi:MAG TPA: hypothetical protein VOB72_08365 [Candidatus Dormibacteraeota bacterium]|nr:hypothetical protein [Candidatus Dormibacteraeota bacterium]